jgi:hypothetical protein
MQRRATVVAAEQAEALEAIRTLMEYDGAEVIEIRRGGQQVNLPAPLPRTTSNRFIVPSVAGPARLVPLTALAGEEFSVAALRQAAQRVRLDAVQGSDGVWRSSQRSLQAYRQSKHQRRPGGRTSD